MRIDHSDASQSEHHVHPGCDHYIADVVDGGDFDCADDFRSLVIERLRGRGRLAQLRDGRIDSSVMRPSGAPEPSKCIEGEPQ